MGWGLLHGQVSACHPENVCLQARDVPLPSSLYGRRSISVSSSTLGTRMMFVPECLWLFTHIGSATSSSRATATYLNLSISDTLVSLRPCPCSIPTLSTSMGKEHLLQQDETRISRTAWKTAGLSSGSLDETLLALVGSRARVTLQPTTAHIHIQRPSRAGLWKRDCISCCVRSCWEHLFISDRQE